MKRAKIQLGILGLLLSSTVLQAGDLACTSCEPPEDKSRNPYPEGIMEEHYQWMKKVIPSPEDSRYLLQPGDLACIDCEEPRDKIRIWELYPNLNIKHYQMKEPYPVDDQERLLLENWLNKV